MARSTTAKSTRRPATSPAPKQEPQMESTFESIGSLFDGKTEGEFQLKLAPEFLELLGIEINPEANYTIVIKNREGKSGFPYRSCFLATEAPATGETANNTAA